MISFLEAPTWNWKLNMYFESPFPMTDSKCFTRLETREFLVFEIMCAVFRPIHRRIPTIITIHFRHISPYQQKRGSLFLRKSISLRVWWIQHAPEEKPFESFC